MTPAAVEAFCPAMDKEVNANAQQHTEGAVIHSSSEAVPGGGQEGEELGDWPIVGPELPKPKKRRVLKFEEQYLSALPCAQMYERSYMHRDTITHILFTATDFLITASIDGHLKFWKKQAEGIEFVKHYRAHIGAVDGLAVSTDGSLLVSISHDCTMKVFDVQTFDLILMQRLPFVPGVAEWIFKKGEARARLVVSELNAGDLHVYDVRDMDPTAPLEHLKLHRAPVTAMRYVLSKDIVVSTDTSGFIEYWCASSYGPPAEGAVKFTSKLDTDLYCLAKAKTHARSLEVSKDGQQFAMVCADSRVRVFNLPSGRLRRTYDESLEAAQELQRSGAELFTLEDIDFGRRVARERELSHAEGASVPNAVFDDSGNMLLYATLVGIKVVNLTSNKVAKVLGKVENTERFLTLTLLSASAKRARIRLHAPEEAAPERDPTLAATSFRSSRFYLITRREPADVEDSAVGRDVFNERPVGEELLALDDGGAAGTLLPRGVVLHTTKGDIVLKLFPDECPKTVENFTTHVRNGYYDSVVFHRVIKGFMLQTGDPLGDGTGGESIWGGEFADEFHKSLRHDRPGILSMANGGPNTNGSQFFITTVPTPWLDNKHTVFGRVVRGMDVVQVIEKVKTDRNDKPFEDIKIINIDALTSVEEG